MLAPRQEPDPPGALGDDFVKALQQRLANLDGIPRPARGTIQFDVARDDDLEPEHFHVTFDDDDDPLTAPGVAPHADDFIETNEAEIGAFVRREAVAGALSSIGDIGLVARLFTALGSVDPKKS